MDSCHEFTVFRLLIISGNISFNGWYCSLWEVVISCTKVVVVVIFDFYLKMTSFYNTRKLRLNAHCNFEIGSGLLSTSQTASVTSVSRCVATVMGLLPYKRWADHKKQGARSLSSFRRETIMKKHFYMYGDLERITNYITALVLDGMYRRYYSLSVTTNVRHEDHFKFIFVTPRPLEYFLSFPKLYFILRWPVRKDLMADSFVCLSFNFRHTLFCIVNVSLVERPSVSKLGRRCSMDTSIV